MSEIPQFVVRFKGRISWEGRANGLPDEIYSFLIFPTGYDRGVMDKAINEQSTSFARNQGMVAQRDQGQIIDMRQMPGDQMFVPMQWIVSITVDAFQLGEELSMPDEKGVERKADGNEPLTN